MSIRSILKEIAPPYAMKVRQRMRERNMRTYASWQEAVADCKSYEDEALTRFRVERQKLQPRNQFLDDDLMSLMLATLPTANSKVVDFGGAAGGRGLQTLARFPAVEYIVVETPAMVSRASSEMAGISFTTMIPASCDIFFTSGTIQYLEDWRPILAQAFQSARYACIFERNSFSETSIIRRQVSALFENGAGPVPDGYQNFTVNYPHRTVSESELRSFAFQSGFDLAYRFPNDTSGLFPYRGLVYGAKLIFLRRR